jgi:haloacetate dehalogenase
MFEDFSSAVIDLGETTIFLRRKGEGPPLLLLHGFPETHEMWHRVAPPLTRDFTVICADLRGYGASGKPPSTPDHAPYAKAAMARDMVAMMEQQGFHRFSLAGHDRGGRVAYRLAIDHRDRVDRLAVLDIIPTGDVLERTSASSALTFWPWSLLSQAEPLPERLILADPAAVVDDALGQWGSDPACFPADLRDAYVAALGDPVTVHAICEEYRAAVTIDQAMDRADQVSGRRIACPTLALWSRDSGLDRWYQAAGGPLGIWRQWAPAVTGRAIDGGHFFPEQNADETVAELAAFFAPGAD